MRKALYILGDLAEEDVVFFARAGSVQSLAAGELCIAAGHEVRALYFVTAGALEVRLAGGVSVARLEVGDVIGEMSFVERRPPEASVVAVEPSRVLAVPRDAIDRALADNLAFAARFYRALAVFLSDRLRAMTARRGGAGDQSLDDHLLDVVHVAGDRFNRLIALLDDGHD